MRFKFTEHVSDILSFSCSEWISEFSSGNIFSFSAVCFFGWSWSTSTSDPVTPAMTRQSVLCAASTLFGKSADVRRKKIDGERSFNPFNNQEPFNINFFWRVRVHTRKAQNHSIMKFANSIHRLRFSVRTESRGFAALNERKNEKKLQLIYMRIPQTHKWARTCTRANIVDMKWGNPFELLMRGDRTPHSLN